MSDYTPNEDQVRDAYVKFAHHDLCLHLDMVREDARRGIAKIKADALREFVDSAQDLLDCAGDTRWKDRALTRADEIEEEA